MCEAAGRDAAIAMSKSGAGHCCMPIGCMVRFHGRISCAVECTLYVSRAFNTRGRGARHSAASSPGACFSVKFRARLFVIAGVLDRPEGVLRM